MMMTMENCLSLEPLQCVLQHMYDYQIGGLIRKLMISDIQEFWFILLEVAILYVVAQVNGVFLP
jgi:hypothetical protein